MKNLARLLFVFCFGLAAMAQNPPAGFYKYAIYAPLPNGTFTPVSLNTATALLTAAGSGNTNTSQPPSGMYKAAVYGMMPNGTFVPLSLDSTGALIVSGGGSSPVSGASAEYPMLDGTGTTVTDISGNGKNATFSTGANAPSWTTYGLAFLNTGTDIAPAQSIITPLATWGTFYVAHCTPTMVTSTPVTTGGVPAAEFPTFTGPSGGTGGVLAFTNNQAQTTYNAVTPAIFNVTATAPTTYLAGAFGGCHVYGYSAGSSTDHLTVDGKELPVYGLQGSSASLVPVTGGTYLIGSGSFGDINALRGVVSYAIYYPTAHTVAQMTQVTSYIEAQLALRPTFPHYPNLTNSTAAQATFIGDSLTATYQGTSPWTGTLSLNNTYQVTNYGISGMFALDMYATATQRWESSIVPGITVAHVWGGTNDLVLGNQTAANAWASLAQIAVQAKRLGARTIVATMIDRGGESADKNALNVLIRGNWKQAGFDYLNDLAEVPGLGADGAAANTACFNGDQTHLTGPGTGTCATVGATDLSGYGVVAALASNAINSMDGSTSSNPSTFTATTVALAPANNYNVLEPTVAQAVSLMDCQGRTNTVTLVNTSTFAVTVSGINSQSITGSAIVAADTTGVFNPVLISPTTGGCFWIRAQ